MGINFAEGPGRERKLCSFKMLVVLLGFLISFTRCGLAAEQTLSSTNIGSKPVPIETPAKPIPLENSKIYFIVQG